MRRLFLAAAFSLGLLASGPVMAAPGAAPHAAAGPGLGATPAQYRDHRDHDRRGYRPPPRFVVPHHVAPRYAAPRYVAPLRHHGRAFPAQQRRHWQVPPRGHRHGWR